MNGSSMVKLLATGWQLEQVRPLPLNVSRKKTSAPAQIRLGTSPATTRGSCAQIVNRSCAVRFSAVVMTVSSPSSWGWVHDEAASTAKIKGRPPTLDDEIDMTFSSRRPLPCAEGAAQPPQPKAGPTRRRDFRRHLYRECDLAIRPYTKTKRRSWLRLRPRRTPISFRSSPLLYSECGSP